MKTNRKNQVIQDQIATHENISLLINDKLDINSILSELSDSVFSIDKESKYVLEILAKNGPLSEYEIGKIGNNYNLNRYSVRRRIFGTNQLPSLLDLGFLNKEDMGEHRTGKSIKKFGLTFKGLMAVLSRTNFEQVYVVTTYFSKFHKITSNKLDLIGVAILHAKYHLALIMLWCKMNRLKLDANLDIGNYFLEGITNHLLRIGNIMEPKDMDWDNYIQVGIRYFTLKHTFISITEKIHRELFPDLYSNSQVKHIIESLKRKQQNPVKSFLIKYLVKDWVLNLEVHAMIPSKNPEIPLIEYGNDQPMDYSWNWVTLSYEADDIYKKIAKSLGLRMSRVKILSEIKYKEN